MLQAECRLIYGDYKLRSIQSDQKGGPLTILQKYTPHHREAFPYSSASG